MVYFIKNVTTELVFTLTEKQTFSNPTYLFVCTHRSLNTQVTFEKPYSDNISIHKDRYDQIVFIGDEFDNEPDGEYVYKIYEKQGASIGALLETGILRLNPIDSVQYEVYQTDNTFVTR